MLCKMILQIFLPRNVNPSVEKLGHSRLDEISSLNFFLSISIFIEEVSSIRLNEQ